MGWTRHETTVKIMIRRLSVLFILIICVVTAHADSSDNRARHDLPQVIGNVENLHEGGYFAKSYVETLKSTRSPTLAYSNSGPLIWARIKKDKEKTIIHIVDQTGEMGRFEFDKKISSSN